MPEAFNSDKFRQLMALRGMGSSNANVASSQDGTRTQPVQQDGGKRIAEINSGLRELNQQQIKLDGGSQLPEVEIIAERMQKHFSLRYHSDDLPTRLDRPDGMEASVEDRYGLFEFDDEIGFDYYVKDCRDFRGNCCGGEAGLDVLGIDKNDDHMYEMLDSAIELRGEREFLGLALNLRKLKSLGFEVSNISDETLTDIEASGGELTEKNAKKKFSKNCKKLKKMSKESISIGKKRLCYSSEDIQALEELTLILQEEEKLNPNFKFSDEGLSGVDAQGNDAQFTPETRKKLTNFIMETYKTAGRDIDAYEKAVEDVKNLKKVDKESVMKIENRLHNYFSR